MIPNRQSADCRNHFFITSCTQKRYILSQTEIFFHWLQSDSVNASVLLNPFLNSKPPYNQSLYFKKMLIIHFMKQSSKYSLLNPVFSDSLQAFLGDFECQGSFTSLCRRTLLPYPVAMYCIAWHFKQVGPYMGLPQVAQLVKNPSRDAEEAETRVPFLGGEDPQRRAATHISILARTSPRTEEPGELCPMPQSQTQLKRPSMCTHVSIYNPLLLNKSYQKYSIS